MLFFPPRKRSVLLTPALSEPVPSVCLTLHSLSRWDFARSPRVTAGTRGAGCWPPCLPSGELPSLRCLRSGSPAGLCCVPGTRAAGSQGRRGSRGSGEPADAAAAPATLKTCCSGSRDRFRDPHPAPAAQPGRGSDGRPGATGPSGGVGGTGDAAWPCRAWARLVPVPGRGAGPRGGERRGTRAARTRRGPRLRGAFGAGAVGVRCRRRPRPGVALCRCCAGQGRTDRGAPGRSRAACAARGPAPAWGRCGDCAAPAPARCGSSSRLAVSAPARGGLQCLRLQLRSGCSSSSSPARRAASAPSPAHAC
ncbi:uncharacterized protein [Ciconia boyciana]|uniref:uncharacterized protein isoform X1 n=1 Tax=Ciconia boyciana TaxID=52775 RepID=UPI003BA1A96A